MSGCPLLCTYCPQDKFKENYAGDKYLSLENLNLVLEKIPRRVRIDFSGMSEPWANPQCTEMLESTLARGFPIAIYTTLYGMKDPERVVEIIQKHEHQV